MISLNEALRNSRADAITTFAGGGAKLRLYTAGYAKLLIEFVLASPFAPPASGGKLTLTIPPATAIDGNPDPAVLARIYKADGTLVMQGLTVDTSNANIILNSASIQAGDQITIASATIEEGNA